MIKLLLIYPYIKRNCLPNRSIKTIVDHLFNHSGLDLKYFKEQYDPEVKRKEESRFKGFNLFNKKKVEKATKHINQEMEESAEEFYTDKKDKEKDDGLSL